MAWMLWAVRGLVVLPSFLASLQAGSRALHILRTGSIGVLEGPLISPESPSWPLVQALGACLELPEPSLLNSEAATYSLDPFLATAAQVQEERLDAQIECILNETYPETSAHGGWNLFRERWVQISLRVEEKWRELRRKPFLEELSSPFSIEDDSASPGLPIARSTLDDGTPIASFAPALFAQLRDSYGVSEEAYRHMLTVDPLVSFQSNSKGAARTGGLFFLTRNGSLLLKTIQRDEAEALWRILLRYAKYMDRHGRRSLLTRFLGLYQVGERIVLVMNSVFPPEAILDERYDLKGSTLGRTSSWDERRLKKKNVVLKDMDLHREVEWMKSRTSRYGLSVGPTLKASLMTQLRHDVQFLSDCGLIDYSLLVGIVQLDRRLDYADVRTLLLSDMQEYRWSRRRTTRELILSALSAPIRLLCAPPLYLAKSGVHLVRHWMWWPLPYWGSGQVGVHAGQLSQLRGERKGRQALYYMGLIDFLQPYNYKKSVEYRAKKMVYGDGFSCVPPADYADRFLAYLDNHLT